MPRTRRQQSSIYIDDETALLVKHMKMLDESMSAFVQRMIREAADARGLYIEPAKVVQK